MIASIILVLVMWWILIVWLWRGPVWLDRLEDLAEVDDDDHLDPIDWLEE